MANKPISTSPFTAWGNFMKKFSIAEGGYALLDFILSVAAVDSLPSWAKITLDTLAGAAFVVGFVDMGMRIAEERKRGGVKNGWKIRNEMGRLCWLVSYLIPILSFVGYVVYLPIPRSCRMVLPSLDFSFLE
jgi:predicted permease